MSDNALKPFAVNMRTALELLGRMSRSYIYEAAGRGELDLIKDGGKTLVTLQSIERRQQSLPRLEVKPFVPRVYNKKPNKKPVKRQRGSRKQTERSPALAG
jgi:hypothetical protein